MIFNSLINYCELLEKFQRYGPTRALRESRTFELYQHRIVYGNNSPIDRILRNGNKFDRDFFKMFRTSHKMV